MSNKWILASKCPHCGGSMTVSVFYSYSRDYRIGRNGQPYKKCKNTHAQKNAGRKRRRREHDEENP